MKKVWKESPYFFRMKVGFAMISGKEREKNSLHRD